LRVEKLKNMDNENILSLDINLDITRLVKIVFNVFLEETSVIEGALKLDDMGKLTFRMNFASIFYNAVLHSCICVKTKFEEKTALIVIDCCLQHLRKILETELLNHKEILDDLLS
jgi:hypothetical protein